MIETKGMIVQFDNNDWIFVLKILSPLEFSFFNINVPNGWRVSDSFIPDVYVDNKLLLLGGKDKNKTILPIVSMVDYNTLKEIKEVWEYISGVTSKYKIVKGDFGVINGIYSNLD